MEQRDFGSTGVKVGEIGFGGWSIGEVQWGSPDVHGSMAAIRAALDAGVTFFDTAQEYGHFKSEEVFGEALGGREGIFVATKTGKYWEEGKFRTDYSPGYIVASAEGSLKRLRTECIDLYQLHNPGVEVSARAETWEALKKLTRQGKIRFYGSSIGSMAELRSAIDGGCAAVQLMVHMADVRELPLLRTAAEAQLAIVCRTPMAWGVPEREVQARLRTAGRRLPLARPLGAQDLHPVRRAGTAASLSGRGEADARPGGHPLRAGAGGRFRGHPRRQDARTSPPERRRRGGTSQRRAARKDRRAPEELVTCATPQRRVAAACGRGRCGHRNLSETIPPPRLFGLLAGLMAGSGSLTGAWTGGIPSRPGRA